MLTQIHNQWVASNFIEKINFAVMFIIVIVIILIVINYDNYRCDTIKLGLC